MSQLKGFVSCVAMCKCFVVFLIALPFCILGADLDNAGIEHIVVPTPAPISGVNCSEYCQCKFQNILEFHRQRQKLISSTGIKYDDEIRSINKYTSFLGFYYSLVVETIVDITCDIGDSRTHHVSSLLNGIEKIKYTSLSITCRKGEGIIWDVPSWQVSFNNFEAKKCNVIPEDDSKGLIIPMNMWFFHVDNVGDQLMEQINIKYTINTLVLSVSGTDTFAVPDSWAGDAMISLDRLNLHGNKLKRFECKIQFTKNLDAINLNKNELARFPCCLLTENKVNLRLLSLSSNAITDVSCLFTPIPSESEVEIIDMSDNLIEHVGRFKPMRKLSVLDLSFNQIRHINDDAFTELEDLTHLYLQNNRIQYIGPVAFRDINLSLLKLNSNFLKSVSVEQFMSSKEIEIDLRKNKFRNPPFVTKVEGKALPSNVKMYSAQNPYHCDCSMLVFEDLVSIMNREEEESLRASSFFVDINQMKCSSPRSTKGKRVLDMHYHESCIVVQDCPENCRCKLLNTKSFIVNCTANRLLEMPELIPIYPDAKVILDLSHNPLQLLAYRWYLANISELLLDNCLITSVTPMAFNAIQNIEVLRLHNNLLQRLPVDVKNMTFKQAINISLHNNRWSCSCDNLWLPRWISTHRSVLWKPESVMCNYLRKPVEDFIASDINCEGYSRKDIIVAVSLIFSSLFSSFLIFFYYNKDIKLILYSKLGIRLCREYNYGDHYNPFDVFVSYGQEDYKWVVDTLVPRLEEGTQPYKLCLHYRDFPADEPTMENIPMAIRLSRCSLLILSEGFMKKEWCILELRAAFQRLLMAANKLIIITTDNLRPEDLTPDLCAYMNTHEYLKIDEPRFWEKLQMLLPPKVIPEELPHEQGVVNYDKVQDGAGDADMNPPTSEHSEPQYLDGDPSFVSLFN